MPPSAPAKTSVCAADSSPAAAGAARAAHDRIDLLLDQAVHRGRGAGGETDTQRCGEERRCGNMLESPGNADHGREHDERHTRGW